MTFYDYSDTYDPVKWNFDESTLNVFEHDGYIYKATNESKFLKLVAIREKINQLCENIIKHSKEIEKIKNTQLLNGINLFLELHMEFYRPDSILPEPFYSRNKTKHSTSRYLLSEMPAKTNYTGMSKPKLLYKSDDLPIIGKDGKGRALYRDVFLNLDLNQYNLNKLIIHELAHSLANHIQFRENDHKKDFKNAENFIAKYYPY
jgi:hypothetical protein